MLFRSKHHNYESARKVYETAFGNLGIESINENFFIQFIRFEMRNKEYDRCRTLFKYGLDNLKKSMKLLDFYVKFEKIQ